MIATWEEYTHELTEYEKKLIPFIIAILWQRWGVESIIKCRGIIAELQKDPKVQDMKIKTSPPRIRKMLHFIRTKGIIPNLVARGKGYFRSNDKGELLRYADSLGHREGTIANLRSTVINYANTL